MTEKIILLPTPRYLEVTGEVFLTSEGGQIVLDSPFAQALFPTAASLQSTLKQKVGAHWEIAAGRTAPRDQNSITLMVVPGCVPHEQGYDLTITLNHIYVVAKNAQGIFYAVQTLRQLVKLIGGRLPTLRCRDWPDFPNRGVMLDISRNKVPSMETLYELVDLFASWKINQLQLYTEHTFAYRKHPVVWSGASPMTGEEILALDAYCRQHFIELVPNQNTFGHMRPWLIHDEYRHLAECPDGCDTPWGHFDEPFSLAPSEPGSLVLVQDLLDELLPHFSSRMVNIGGDEPVDLEMAQGRSGKLVEELGVGRVYLDFLMKIYQEVKVRGFNMQFWGDIIMEHPELTPELPRDAIALEWGYEADHAFDEHGAIYKAAGVPFYVCPGTSSWRTVAGRTDNALGNLRNAAVNGRKHGAVGYLNTDWGDNGHWQPLPVSYLGFAYGAALAWDYENNLNINLSQALDIYVFHDTNEVMGKLVYNLGNVDHTTGFSPPNSTILFNILQASPADIQEYLRSESEIDLEDLAKRFQATLAHIDEVMAPLPSTDMHRADAELIKREFTWAANMLRHACWRALWVIDRVKGKDTLPLQERLSDQAQGLIEEFKTIWHARNRPGGFQDSVARLEFMRSHYHTSDLQAESNP